MNNNKVIETNTFKVNTINIKVKNLTKFIDFLHLFFWRRFYTTVSYQGVIEIFLLSSSIDEKGITVCISESGNNVAENISLGLRATNENYLGGLRLIDDAGIELKGFKNNDDLELVEFNYHKHEFVNEKMKLFNIENKPFDELELNFIKGLMDQFGDIFYENVEEGDTFSYMGCSLKALGIKVQELDSYVQVFEKLGFTMSSKHYDRQILKSVVITVNEKEDFSLILIEEDFLQDQPICTFILKGDESTFMEYLEDHPDFNLKEISHMDFLFKGNAKSHVDENNFEFIFY